MKKNAVVTLLTAALLLSLLSTPVFGAQMQTDLPAWGNNENTVAFGGNEWYVIGTKGIRSAASGIAWPTMPDESLTLFLKAQENVYGNSPFRAYYDNRWEGATLRYPSEYGGSSLAQKMASLAKAFPAKEKLLILPRTLTAAEDDISPNRSNAQTIRELLWPLSRPEFERLQNKTVERYGQSDFWLRSPFMEDQAYVAPGTGTSGSPIILGLSTGNVAVRPAFNLDTKNLFLSSNIEAEKGKSAAKVGGGFVPITPVKPESGPVKLTMSDNSPSLLMTAGKNQTSQSGKTLLFPYEKATTGAGRYISCLLTKTSDNGKSYAKLASLGQKDKASGTLSIPVGNLEDGTYAIKLFTEEVNTGLYTDFANSIATIMADVKDGIGTVNGISSVPGMVAKTSPSKKARSTKVTAFGTAQKTIYIQRRKSVKLPFIAYAGKTASQTFSWKSSKKKIASVKAGKAAGKLKATSNKNAGLTIKATKKTGTSKITLRAASGKSITWTVKVVKRKKNAKASSLKIKNLPAGNNLAINKKATLKAAWTTKATAIAAWKSSAPAVATIDAAGRITAKAKGNTTITLKVGKRTKKTKITVR